MTGRVVPGVDRAAQRGESPCGGRHLRADVQAGITTPMLTVFPFHGDVVEAVDRLSPDALRA